MKNYKPKNSPTFNKYASVNKPTAAPTKSPVQPPSSQKQREEIADLHQKVVDLIIKAPEKAALILSQWVNHPQKPKKKK